MDQEAANKLFGSLKKAIDAIYEQNASSLSFEELYRNAYNLVLNKHGEFLYEGICASIRGHLELSASLISSKPNEDLLTFVVREWESHKTAFKMVKDILMYMDKTYVTPRKKTPVYIKFLQLFREVITSHPDIKTRLRDLILHSITQERQGYLIDRDVIKNILSMYEDFGMGGCNVYEEDFEIFFLTETTAFYHSESLEFIAQNSCPEYMIKVENRLAEEAARVKHYLSSSTELKLRSIVEYELITEHAKSLIDMESSGLKFMLADAKLEDLARMYSLFSRIQICVEQLREGAAKYVLDRGMQIMESRESSKEALIFLTLVLELKDKFDKITSEAFRGDKKMMLKLKEVFESFLNVDNRSAAHLATYIDDLLRSGLNSASDADVENKLEKVIVIFKYLHNKDVFECFYKNLLSKRLLAGKIVSDEVEKTMISKLKAECGYQFTSKLEGMFVDIGMSKEIMEQYKKTPGFISSPIEVDIHMLTAGFWPLHNTPPCALPSSLSDVGEKFTSFYINKHNGRKLTWMHNLGSVDLKAVFTKTKKEYILNVSMYQMVILLQFNGTDTLSLDAIRTSSGIQGEVDLRRHLLSLCTPKMRILRKHSKSKGVEDDDQFTFHEEFTSKFKRMKVPLLAAKEIQLSDAHTSSSSGAHTMSGLGGIDGMGGMGDNGVPPAVEEERRHLIEASIVRIMKARKTLPHHDLVAESTRQLSNRFSVQPQAIKRRIESLIEREYLERSPDDARIYNYSA